MQQKSLKISVIKYIKYLFYQSPLLSSVKIKLRWKTKWIQDVGNFVLRHYGKPLFLDRLIGGGVSNKNFQPS